MTALAADRVNQLAVYTKSRAFDSVAASVTIYVGAMCAMDSSGYIRPARATAGDKVVGVATRRIPSQSGAGAPSDGGKVLVDSDSIQRLGNSATTDAITNSHVGRDCFVVDDQTVALTSLGGTRPRAGRIHKVDATGVFVDFAAQPNLRVTVGPLAMTDVSAASDSAIGYAPISGKVVEVWGVLGGAITGADSIVTPKIATVAVTGTMTVANVASGAGVRSYMHPSAANAVVKGQALVASSDGASSTTATMTFYFEIEAD